MKEEGLPSEEIEVAAQVTNNTCCTLNSRQRIRATHLMGDTCHQAPENELSRMDNIVLPMALGRDAQRSTPGQQALISREPSIALNDGQGIPDQLDSNSELYDGITQMIHVVLNNNIDMDPEKSVLA